ncbi:RNA polymerase sigma factor [Oceanicoccus sp. KOV_DT_Chl]|uniref:RNA polymerase sigma factor n=1 Tax=Oceanicoccus sp. KOV_DT_Chl TaxID=1904639 RepID=UPI000C7E00AC|nr:RNA polymerase sigma factor [Oceanicoccus sp. KOV_DT_Chl]
MTADNDDFIRRAQRGDREAFARVVEEYYGLMFGVASKFCGNRSDAEDVTQLACIKLGRSIGQFRFESAFSSWLYRLVINCAKDFVKTQKPLTLEDPPELSVSSEAEPAVLLRQVLTLVDSMGEGFRAAVTLVMGEGLTHAEAAVILEVKESTVSWRLHEVRKRLQANSQLEGGV